MCRGCMRLGPGRGTLHNRLMLPAVSVSMDPQPPSASDQRAEERTFERTAAFYTTLDKVIRANKLYRGEGDLLERMFGDLERCKKFRKEIPRSESV